MLFEQDLSEAQTKTMQDQISKLKPSPECHSKVTRRVETMRISTLPDIDNPKSMYTYCLNA